MHRADFAIDGCADGVVREVKARVHNAAKTDDLATMAGTQLATQPTVITDVKALPASGLVATSTTDAAGSAPPIAGRSGRRAGGTFASLAPAAAPEHPAPAAGLAESQERVRRDAAREARAHARQQARASWASPTATRSRYAQTTVRVKGTAGSDAARSR